MEEVYEVGPNKLRKNYWSLRTFLGTINLLLFPGVEKVVISTPKPDNFIKLFWTFVSVPVRARCFLYVPGILMNTLLDYFEQIFEFFPYLIFYSIAGQKFKMK